MATVNGLARTASAWSAIQRRVAMICLWMMAAASSAAGEPIRFLFLMDESGSLEMGSRATDPHRLRVDAVRLMLWLSSPDDRFAAVGFGKDARLLNGGSTDSAFTPVGKDAATATGWVEGISGRAKWTHIHRGLALGLKCIRQLPRSERPVYTVLFTDGQIGETDLESEEPDEVQAECRRLADLYGEESAPILAVALGRNANVGLLADLARRSRGWLYTASRADDLRQIYGQLFVSVANRFHRQERGVRSPIELDVQPSTESVLALAFTSPGASSPQFRFARTTPAGSSEDASIRFKTSSWSLAKLIAPSPGKWSLAFDESGAIDMLFVKSFSSFGLDIVQPTGDALTVGQRAPIRVTVHGDQASSSLGLQFSARLTAPDGQEAVVVMQRDKTGYAGQSASLVTTGQYELQVKATLKDDSRFSCEKRRTFLAVAPTPVCSFEVTIPSDGLAIAEDTPITIRARSTHAASGRPCASRLLAYLVDSSGTDQLLGESVPGGELLTTGIPLLPVGEHRIDIRMVAGPGELAAGVQRRTVRVSPRVYEQPTVTMVSPRNGETPDAGKPIPVVVRTRFPAGVTLQPKVWARLQRGTAKTPPVQLTAAADGRYQGTLQSLKPGIPTHVKVLMETGDARYKPVATQVSVTARRPTPTLQVRGASASHCLVLREPIELQFQLQAATDWKTPPRFDVTLQAPGETRAAKIDAQALQFSKEGKLKINIDGPAFPGTYRLRIIGQIDYPDGLRTFERSIELPVLLEIDEVTAGKPVGTTQSFSVPLRWHGGTPVQVQSVVRVSQRSGSPAQPGQPTLTTEVTSPTLQLSAGRWASVGFRVTETSLGKRLPGSFRFEIMPRLTDPAAGWSEEVRALRSYAYSVSRLALFAFLFGIATAAYFVIPKLRAHFGRED